MAIFNSYVSHYQRVIQWWILAIVSESCDTFPWLGDPTFNSRWRISGPYSPATCPQAQRNMGKCWDCTSPSELQGSTGPLGVTVNLNVMKSGWWFQPLWKILVSCDYCSQYMGKKNMFQTTTLPHFTIPRMYYVIYTLATQTPPRAHSHPLVYGEFAVNTFQYAFNTVCTSLVSHLNHFGKHNHRFLSSGQPSEKWQSFTLQTSSSSSSLHATR